MKRPLIALAAMVVFAGLAGCARKETPFVPTAIPRDFAIIVDDNLDTYYTRQHVQQVITLQDMISHTTYRSFRDFNNTLSSSFTQEQPLTEGQLQAMWDQVAQNQLLANSKPWMNWLSEADIYRHKEHTIQIRAHGQVKSFHAQNGYLPQMRALMLLVDSVRLPIGQKGTPVVGRPQDMPRLPASSPTLDEPSFPPVPAPAPRLPELTPPAAAPPAPAAPLPVAAPGSAPLLAPSPVVPPASLPAPPPASAPTGS